MAPQSPIQAIAMTQVLFPTRPYLAQNLSPPLYIRVPTVQTCLHSENDTSIGKLRHSIRRHRSNSSFSRHRKQRHDRPIRCTVDDCQYRAAFNRDLKRHMASKHPQETSKERHFCHYPNCDRAPGGIWNGFARKDTLKRHLSTKIHKTHEHETDRN
jgi:hypothetical protein